MAKIIVRCNYLDGAPPAQLANYVRYIGTRPGVDLTDNSKMHLPATHRQNRRIDTIIKDFPGSADSLEYQDYLHNPTRGNASEFITAALEQNMGLVATLENYVDYLANRPRVERIGEHGLFTDEGEPVILSHVQDEVANRDGRLWTHIVSLHREDAERLGYDQGAMWQALIRSKRAKFAEVLDIPDNELKWYAAFHNESHHPHVHIMLYSTGEKQGYLTEKGINALRSSLAHEIFQNDFMHSYRKKDEAEKTLRQNATTLLADMAEQVRGTATASDDAATSLLALAASLKNTGCTKKYQYLKPAQKRLVDEIMGALAKDSDIEAMYRIWCDAQNEVVGTYRKEPPPLPPLEQNKDFKVMRNEIVAEAVRLSQEDGIHPAELPEEEPVDISAGAAQPMEDDVADQESGGGDAPPDDGDEDATELDETTHDEPPLPLPDELEDVEPVLDWSDKYREAKSYLYGNAEGGRDLPAALRLFTEEAAQGNALACHDLGRMWADGLGCEADATQSDAWYKRALAAFEALHRDPETRPRSRAYLAYRIGKMYSSGQGCETDYAKAAGYLEEAARAGNKYAKYSLASLLRQGKGVEQDYVRARELYRESADQDFPYASYELGKMMRDGVGGHQNPEGAITHFVDAFQGFQIMEEESADDKLQYRLGAMLLDGMGVETDEAAATQYLRSAAEVGNSNAQYRLAKLALSREPRNEAEIAEAIALLEKAAGSGNAQAMFALGKLFRDGDGVEQDPAHAMELFVAAAEQNNDYAAYAAGKMLEKGELVEQDLEGAEAWYLRAAALGNPYAAYRLSRLYLGPPPIPGKTEDALRYLELAVEAGVPHALYQKGKLLLDGELLPRDVETAIDLLTRAADQDHDFAAFALGRLYHKGELVPRDISTAEMWLERSVAAGNVFAMERLASLYLKEFQCDGTKVRRAIGFLEQAVAEGSGQAQYSLGRLLLEGELIPKDIMRARTLLLSSARQENPFAAYTLGRMFQDGDGAPRDVPTAIRWYTQAARQGHAPSMCRLGRFYLDGTETAPDPAAGLAWLEAAVAKGSNPARYLLATTLLKHEYIPPDPQRALELLHLAASEGHAYAMYRLGKLLLTGEAGPADPQEGERWLRQAAAAGVPQAGYTLGIALITGAAHKDTKEGLTFLRAAAESGDAFAQFQLGKFLLQGIHVQQNKEEAIHWLERSVAQGNPYAAFYLEHADAIAGPGPLMSATRLLKQLSQIFDGTLPPRPGAGAAAILIDSKRRRKLREKLIAAGHKEDDSMESLKA